MKRKAAQEKAATPKKTKAPEADDAKELAYISGFGAEIESEALPNALPKGQLTPQKCAYGLKAEQLSGTSFTTPRVHNKRSWLYRIVPSCVHPPLVKSAVNEYFVSDFSKCEIDPNQTRWAPVAIPDTEHDLVEGIKSVGGTGSVETKHGFGIHMYTATKSMGDKSFANSDGDFLFVPQQGTLHVRTEFGRLTVAPREIFVVQRGMKFSVDIEGPSRGYILEVFDGHFRLPDLGPIGANGLANPRDFMHPVAWYENRKCKFMHQYKFLGELWETELNHSPYDVVAWCGNYVPYKYDLNVFVACNSVTVDHMDPSIFTVLTCPTLEPGVACADFVIFPPRYMVQEHTFRPPYYHRNCMTEFMGNIAGQYDAKPEGFLPGGASLHSIMIGHGPDASTYDKASKADVSKPGKIPDSDLAFMFESTYSMRLTAWALHTAKRDENYQQCWDGLEQDEFDPTKP